MNYILFANPQTGSAILSELMKTMPPKLVITRFNNKDSWKSILYRFITNRLTTEDKLRFFYKLEFYDFNSLNIKRLKHIINKNNIHIGFITTFSNFIPKEYYELFPNGLYNFHPSLLPKHGGANPIFWVIYHEDKFTGTTCHRVTEILDHGRILLQSRHLVNNMNSRELFKLYCSDVKDMILRILFDYDNLINSSIEMETVEYDPKEIPKFDLKDRNIDSWTKRKISRAIMPISLIAG